MYRNRHLLLIEDKYLLMIDDVLGINGKNVGVDGNFQTPYPVKRIENGWEIKGPNHQLAIHCLFDLGLQRENQWNHDGPITQLFYRNISDRLHSVQPILLSFEETAYNYEMNQNGFKFEIDNKKYEFLWQDKQLVFMPQVKTKKTQLK